MRLQSAALFLPLLFASPAVATDWNLDGKWQIVKAQPPLPEARGQKGTLRISAYPSQPAALRPDGAQAGQYDLAVSGACNSMSGMLEISGGVPDFQASVSTAQVCPDERGAFDRAFHRAVFGAEHISLQDGLLMLNGPQGRLVFGRAV